MKTTMLAVILALPVVTSNTASAQTVTVPMHLRKVSGTRPFLRVELNGVPYLFMLHANADFYAMTTHRNAEAAKISVPPPAKRYGIEKRGQVSSLGRAETWAKIAIGWRSFSDIPLSVFETPQNPPMNGMLGVKWIRASRCIVDYSRKIVTLPGTPSDTVREDAAIRARGYAPHAMTWDPEKKRYSVKGTVNGVPIDLNVSTVAGDVLDISFAREAGIELGQMTGQAGGPTGTLENQFATRHAVSITIGGQRTAPSRPVVWNLAGYDRSVISAQKATIGADFMLANRAVIDFGTSTLYLPRS